MPSRTLTPLITGLAFSEGPRWHDGRLFFSDMHNRVVQAATLDADGMGATLETICEVPGDPSGLGWLPDGRMLISSMLDRRLLRLEPTGEIVEHADLSSLASWHINDMVVDTTGRAYVGNFGFDLHGPPPWDVAPAEIVIVEPDGAARIGDDDVLFPNGSVITPDGATLIVGQTFGNELLAWDIDPETGDLSNRRQWADLGERRPDGICLDANGAIWIAEPVTGGCFLIAEGGEVIDTIETDDKAFACMLGGPERRHLFVLTSAEDDPAKTVAAASGKISVVEVEVPGAGWP